MPIEYEGLSDRRSASRMGKIRLGKKGRNAKGVEYPEKLDYFRIDPSDESLLPKLLELLGAKPKRLRIMFVSGDREVIFPQYLRKYGKSGLLCKGTGGTDAGGNPLPAVLRVVDTETGAVVDDYPCDPATCQDYQGKRCKRVASLSGFILCEFPNIRTWQIDTTSKVSIENLNSRFDELENLLTAAGRGRTVAGVPLILTLNPIRVKARDKKGKPLKGKQTVFVMDLDLDTESLMSDSPPLAFLSRLATGDQIDAPAVDERAAPDGLFDRSQVEEGADPVAERIETAEEQAEQAPELPDDIIEGVRIIGMTNRQVKGLARRYTRGDEFDEETCLMYLNTLVDLATAETDISALLHSLEEEETAEQAPEAEVVDAEEEDAEEEQEETPAAETKQTKVEESTEVLGLEI